tara:strand:- start:110 stop:469 length:360 start_codon:yes stop_codon:yes gene_type:complete
MNNKEIAKKITAIRLNNNHSVICFDLKIFDKGYKAHTYHLYAEGVYNHTPLKEKAEGWTSYKISFFDFDNDNEHYFTAIGDTALDIAKEIKRQFPFFNRKLVNGSWKKYFGDIMIITPH